MAAAVAPTATTTTAIDSEVDAETPVVPKKANKGGILGYLFPKQTPQEKEEKLKKLEAENKRKALLDKQIKLLKEEINLSWRVVFGEKLPEKKKDTYMILNITRRNIWMEDNYLYNFIKSFKPEEFYHPPHKYILKWQPVGSLYQVIIPLDNMRIQENALEIISNYSKLQQRRLVFFFCPVDPTMNLFAERIHPASLVSYRTQNLVLKKLCEIFLEGRLSVIEIQQILLCDHYVWSASLYNLLPEDEQVFHTYLNEGKPLEDISKSLAKSFIDHEITLEEYEDKKFPERKKLKDIENMIYPLPYQKEQCVICLRENVGIICCNACANMVCGQCMRVIFGSGRRNAKNKIISFLLMHQKYCMKLGDLPPILSIIEDEPAYLREFRLTSQYKSLEILLPKNNKKIFYEEELSEDEEEKENKRKLLEEKARLLALEEARILRENPFSLRELRIQLNLKLKRLEKIKKDIFEFNEKISDNSRTLQYIARNVRLRNEALELMKIQVELPIDKIEHDGLELQLTGEFINMFIKDIQFARDEMMKLREVKLEGSSSTGSS